MSTDNKKRYILYSKDDGRPDHLKPCAFFASADGCRNGSKCRFLHDENNKPQDTAKKIAKEDRKNNDTKRSNGSKVENIDSRTATLLQMQQQLQEQQRLLEEQLRLHNQSQDNTKKGNSSEKKKRKHGADSTGVIDAVPISTTVVEDDDDDDELIFGTVNHVLEVSQRPSYSGEEGHQNSGEKPVEVKAEGDSNKKKKKKKNSSADSVAVVNGAGTSHNQTLNSVAPAVPMQQPGQQPRPRANSLGFTPGIGHLIQSAAVPTNLGSKPVMPAPSYQLGIENSNSIELTCANSSQLDVSSSLSNVFVKPDEVAKALQTSGTTHATHGNNKNIVKKHNSIFASPKGKVTNTDPEPVAETISSNQVADIVPFDVSKVDLSELPWVNLVKQTMAHHRYELDYGLLTNGNQLLASDPTWVQSRAYGDWCAGAVMPRVLALDCEMCETTDPVTGEKHGNTLVRVSVVNGLNPDQVLIDSLVSPGLPVSDARTHIHGITEEQMMSAPWTLRHAQAALLAICCRENAGNGTILIGHSLHNDMKSLRFCHDLVVDTAYLFALQGEPGKAASLRDIAEQILGKPLSDQHDSIHDASTALCAAAKLLVSGPQPAIRRKLPITGGSNVQNSVKQPSLLVHRIPDFCNEKQVMDMIVSYTQIMPVAITPIQRSYSSTGAEANGKVPSGKASAVFASQQHCDLAFDSIPGPDRPDKQNRPQKRVYLKGGGYICVRK